MRKRNVFFISLLALTALVLFVPALLHIIFVPNTFVPNTYDRAEATTCKAKGGIYEQAGLAGYYRCTMPFPDGGKECVNSNECSSGQCLITEDSQKVGKCKKDDSSFGCFGKIEDRIIICAD